VFDYAAQPALYAALKAEMEPQSAVVSAPAPQEPAVTVAEPETKKAKTKSK
jgi:hypothetical protein